MTQPENSKDSASCNPIAAADSNVRSGLSAARLAAFARLVLYLAILCATAWLVVPFLPDKSTKPPAPPTPEPSPFQLPESLDVDGHWQITGSRLGLSVSQLSRTELDSELKAAVDQLSNTPNPVSEVSPAGEVKPADAVRESLAIRNSEEPAISEPDQSLELQQTVSSLLSLLPARIREVNGYRVHTGQHFGTSFQVITGERANGPVHSALVCWPAENQLWNFARIIIHADDAAPSADWAPENLPISGPPLAVRRKADGQVSGAAWPCGLTSEQLLEWLRTNPGDFVLDECAPEFLIGRWESSRDSPPFSLISLHSAEFGLLILLK